jgi:hypothetical protein
MELTPDSLVNQTNIPQPTVGKPTGLSYLLLSLAVPGQAYRIEPPVLCDVPEIAGLPAKRPRLAPFAYRLNPICNLSNITPYAPDPLGGGGGGGGGGEEEFTCDPEEAENTEERTVYAEFNLFRLALSRLESSDCCDTEQMSVVFDLCEGSLELNGDGVNKTPSIRLTSETPTEQLDLTTNTIQLSSATGIFQVLDPGSGRRVLIDLTDFSSTDAPSDVVVSLRELEICVDGAPKKIVTLCSAPYDP